MTETALPKRWPVRITRAFMILALVYNLAWGVFELSRGHAYGLICLILVPAIAGTLAWQVRYLRHEEVERNRPRPDYAAIARMEREVWGRAFDHDGTPERRAVIPAAALGGVTMVEFGQNVTQFQRWVSARPARSSTCAACGYWQPHGCQICRECDRQRRHGDDHRPDATAPATVDQYAAWLRGYLKRGGKPTHYCDHPFGNAGFRYASTRLTIDSGYEFGARSRMIVVASGVPTQRTNPAGPFGGWGHTKLYFMHGYRTNDSIVPVYSDPEFDFAR